MLETTISCGKCPQCGGKTKRTVTESYPFSDEEETTIEEHCLTEGCDFVHEGFSSSNATTNFYHYYKDFGNQRNAEKKRG